MQAVYSNPGIDFEDQSLSVLINWQEKHSIKENTEDRVNENRLEKKTLEELWRTLENFGELEEKKETTVVVQHLMSI